MEEYVSACITYTEHNENNCENKMCAHLSMVLSMINQSLKDLGSVNTASVFKNNCCYLRKHFRTKTWAVMCNANNF